MVAVKKLPSSGPEKLTARGPEFSSRPYTRNNEMRELAHCSISHLDRIVGVDPDTLQTGLRLDGRRDLRRAADDDAG